MNSATKVITLENFTDIKDFVECVYLESQKGKEVVVSLHDYKATVSPKSDISSIRLGIIGKLRDIQNVGSNLQALRNFSTLSEDEIDLIAKTMRPDEIADLCLEFGICGMSTAPSKTL